jgi:hypothetical protein
MKRSPRVLDTANKREVARSQWGQFTYGPAIDGTYVHDLPGREFLHDNFVKNITILQGHNEFVTPSPAAIDVREEGLLFVDPILLMASERQTRMKLRQNLPIAPLSALHQIKDLYPSPSLSGGQYAHQFDRVNAMISGPPQPLSQLTNRMDLQLQHPVHLPSVQPRNVQLPLQYPAEYPCCGRVSHLYGFEIRLERDQTEDEIAVCAGVAVIFD